ncbi:MAG: hypothetical protein K2Z81_04965, partial [Cyanobacteria bacterium]|nr:hypothetical protein [Cyanobacteriota bacterium]
MFGRTGNPRLFLFLAIGLLAACVGMQTDACARASRPKFSKQKYSAHNFSRQKSSKQKSSTQKVSAQKFSKQKFETEFHLKAQAPDKRLKEINQRRDELRKKICETRKKERLAYSRLNYLNHKLNKEKRELDQKQKKLRSTENTMKETSQNLMVSSNRHHSTVHDASFRLRDIYEGRQMSLIETIFRADSMQELMDLSYYHEKIVTQDKALVGTLRAKTEALAARKASLNNEISILSSIANAFM